MLHLVAIPALLALGFALGRVGLSKRKEALAEAELKFSALKMALKTELYLLEQKGEADAKKILAAVKKWL